MPIAKAIAKYGQENFDFQSVQECFNQEELNQAERGWADKLNSWAPSGYNLRAGNGFGAMTDELKRRISEGNKGKVMSAEARCRSSISHKGYIVPADQLAERSKYMKGKKLPQAVHDGASRSAEKSYVLRNDSGTLVSFTNMRKFCEEHGYHSGRMSELVRGKRSHYRGWTFVSCEQSQNERKQLEVRGQVAKSGRKTQSSGEKKQLSVETRLKVSRSKRAQNPTPSPNTVWQRVRYDKKFLEQQKAA